VLNLEVPDAELVRRMEGRAAKKAGPDDTPGRSANGSWSTGTNRPPYRLLSEARQADDIPGLGTVEEIAARAQKAVGK